MATENAAKKLLLTPDNHVLLLIDHQPQMAFGVQSIDRQALVNNVTGLAKAAKVFKVPTILTTVAEKSFSGPLFPEVQAVFPDQKPIDRTTMNTWEDERVVAAVKKTGRKKLVIASLWTEVCLALPAILALDEGYEVYIVTDASGGVTLEAHEMAVRRMIQAGAVPITWTVFASELQRDWARTATVPALAETVRDHMGVVGTSLLWEWQLQAASKSEAGVGV